MPQRKFFPTPGRRLYAAMTSHLLRYSGVDRALREQGDGEAPQEWEDLAMSLIRKIQSDMTTKVLGRIPRRDKSSRVVQ